MVAGCVATPAPPPVPHAIPKPPTYSVAGLESVMGKNGRALEALFGKPRLDIHEGEARKLQFVGSVCILDAYLYPPQQGGDAITTYLDARLPDGRDADRASCVGALIRQEEAK